MSKFAWFVPICLMKMKRYWESIYLSVPIDSTYYNFVRNYNK